MLPELMEECRIRPLWYNQKSIFQPKNSTYSSKKVTKFRHFFRLQIPQRFLFLFGHMVNKLNTSTSIICKLQNPGIPAKRVFEFENLSRSQSLNIFSHNLRIAIIEIKYSLS